LTWDVSPSPREAASGESLLANHFPSAIRTGYNRPYHTTPSRKFLSVAGRIRVPIAETIASSSFAPENVMSRSSPRWTRVGSVAFAGAALVAIFPLVSCQAQKQLTGAAKPANKHALLVGVTFYEHLPERFHLRGPANDVLLMKDMLMNQFAFASENITILSEAEGKKDAKLLPSRLNIKREWERLAKVAHPGDQIVIMMGGHGSQQPEDPNSKDPEPDGLDEIFLPRDVKEWEGDATKVPNAIIDDEIGEWLKAITDKKAFVWVVFDSCHSGTMTRDIEMTRQIKAEFDLKIPKVAIQKAQDAALERDKKLGKVEGKRGGGPAEPQRTPPPEGGVVALYACQEIEVTVEKDMPVGSPDAKPYGLLSYTIAQVLTQSFQNNGKPPTYRELLQRIHAAYGRMGRTAPTPQMEGAAADRDREVLGTTSWPGRSMISFRQDGAGWKINAGTLHGMTEGSILGLYPAAAEKDSDKLLGYAKITQTKMLSATIEPTDFNKTNAPAKLAKEGRCEVVQIDLSNRKLRLALDPIGGDGKPLSKAESDAWSKDIDAVVAKWATQTERVEAPADADWILRGNKGKLYLLPISEVGQKLEPGTPGMRFGPFPIGNEPIATSLQERVLRIIRADGLKKLAGAPVGEVARSVGNNDLKLETTIFRYPDGDEKKGIPLLWDKGAVKLYAGDRVGMIISNKGQTDLDVTVLYLDNAFGIDCFFPRKGDVLNRIRPGGTLRVPPEPAEITADTFGPENLLVITVKATTKEPMEFSFLSQPSLEQARAVRPPMMPKTPLEDVLKANLFDAGTTRAITRRAAEEFSLRMIPWNVSPNKREVGKK
jgi:hypothetical protein